MSFQHPLRGLFLATQVPTYLWACTTCTYEVPAVQYQVHHFLRYMNMYIQ